MEYIYNQQALRLHKETPVIDSHCDLAGELLLRHRNGEERVIERLYLPHWKTAGFQLIVSSIYIENAVFFPKETASDWTCHWTHRTLCWEQGFVNALEQIEIIKQEISELPEELCLVTSKKELVSVKKQQKIGILLYMEGLDCIGPDLDKIKTLYRLGVRGASLTWSRPNLLATGCCTAAKFIEIPGQITSLGFQAIELLEKLHMFLDISHLNNEGWEQIRQLPHTIPYIATHSNSYKIHPNYRNLTDEQMYTLAQQGGIMGLNACKYIVGVEHPTDYLDAMCRHVEYIIKTIGVNHLGYGFDLCDSYSKGKYQKEDIEPEDCLQNHKEALLLTARLLERGMSEQNVLRVISLNWLEYFEALLD